MAKKLKIQGTKRKNSISPESNSDFGQINIHKWWKSAGDADSNLRSLGQIFVLLGGSVSLELLECDVQEGILSEMAEHEPVTCSDFLNFF